MEKKLIIAILVFLAVIFILAVVSFKYWVPDEVSNGGELPQKENGIVVNIWTEKEKLDIIKEYGIKYLFVDVGDTGQDGKLLTSEDEIKRFLEKVEEFEEKNNYEFVILPYSEVNTYDYNFNKEFQENFIEDYLKLVGVGFDGVYVDVEPVRDGEDYLEFLDRVRKEFSFVGVYSGALGSHSDNEWEWDLEFYDAVCSRVDLIFVPGYDSDSGGEKEYKNYIKKQVEELSSANLNCDLMLGVPTHKTGAENLEDALEVYSSSENNKFIGVGVFAEWKTSKEEWKIFKRFVR